MYLGPYVEDDRTNGEAVHVSVHYLCYTDPIGFLVHLMVSCLEALWSRFILSSYHCDWDGRHLHVLQPRFHWHTIRHYAHLHCRHNHVLSKKDRGNKNWQKLFKLLPCRSYSGSCGIETPTTLSNEVIEVTKRPDFFDFFTIDINRQGVSQKMMIVTIFRTIGNLLLIEQP